MPTTENITVLFTDLVGSTELSASLSPEASDDVRRRHFSALRQAIATSGGTEVKNLGDGLMVVFPVASAALVCAVAMQQAVHRDNAKAERSLGLRVALSAGEATKEDGDYFGEPVVEAARLCARAEGGQILIADVVRANAGRRSPHAFTSLGELELKGLPEPIETLESAGSPSQRRKPPRRAAYLFRPAWLTVPAWGWSAARRSSPLFPPAPSGWPRARVARSSSSPGNPARARPPSSLRSPAGPTRTG